MQKNSSLLLLALSVAVFGVITTEIAIIGLLPKLVSQLNVTPAQVGFLVSIYALVVAATGPFITLMLSGFNKKTVMLTILVVFIISNLTYATSSSFHLNLAFRVLPALAHAVFFAVALVVAANSVPAEKHAAACALALTGVIFMMPSMPATQKMSFKSQLSVLRKGKLWLTIATVTFVFAAMFSSFSYVADYLEKVTALNNNLISAMLILFGVCGFIGNFIFSSLLQKNLVKTTHLYPLFYILVFALVWGLGFSLFAMSLLIVFWGAFHSSGLVISQSWLMREAHEAPEFANSLYMSFSNLGITVGSLTGGWFIAHLGTHSVVISSAIFALLAFFTIAIKHRAGSSSVALQEETSI
ncbi:MFS transporter [Pantoea sp. A4]|uniref:MFS transporter n=1 Tax=Pantoea sp. A4 TaxID=1225184 RepID=UPI000366BF8A|nr:MFS transporter [Pantoea sp. A4]